MTESNTWRDKFQDSLQDLTATVASVAAELKQMLSIQRTQAEQIKDLQTQDRDRRDPKFAVMIAFSALLVSIGTLALGPVRSDVDDLEVGQAATIKALNTNTSDISSLSARVNENERELGILWQDPNLGAFAYLEWKGRMEAIQERHEFMLERRISEFDGEQNARLTNLEKLIEDMRVSDDKDRREGASR